MKKVLLVLITVLILDILLLNAAEPQFGDVGSIILISWYFSF